MANLPEKFIHTINSVHRQEGERYRALGEWTYKTSTAL